MTNLSYLNMYFPIRNSISEAYIAGRDGCLSLSYSNLDFSFEESGKDDSKFLYDPDNVVPLLILMLWLKNLIANELLVLLRSFLLSLVRSTLTLKSICCLLDFPLLMINSIIWNIQGINKAPEFHRLKLFPIHRLLLVCILELFLNVAEQDFAKVHLGMKRALFS